MGTIQVSNLGKAYRKYSSRWARLAEWVLPRGRPRHEQHWVIRDVNFRVEPGEAVGIIGVNGAGKSTLLKMITGTTQPSTGSVAITGRVAAMLELGMGFHPEFTGRQNVYMAGQLLGYSTQEIGELMPQIEAFAEIGEYIDQPVRVYSSGMQMRLAFSVAVARRPDVLIVDEALSVGDDYFQHKSFDRIREFARQGTTLLIVSHDKQAIQSICDRAILLDGGRVAMEGEPEAVMDYYNALIAMRDGHRVSQVQTPTGVQTVSGTGEAAVTGISLMNVNGERIEVAEVGQEVLLSIEVEARADLERLVLGYMIKDRLGQPMFGTNTHHLKRELVDVKSGEQFVFDFRFSLSLGTGSYSVATALTSSHNHLERNYEWRDLAFVFTVVNGAHPHFVGCAFLPPQYQIRRVA